MDAQHLLTIPPQVSPPLLVRVDRGADPRVQYISVAGELDAVTVPTLQQAVGEVLREHRPGRVEIGLRDVTFLDSAGIRALLLCRADAVQAGCQLRLTDPHPMAYRVLKIMGLLDYFGVTECLVRTHH